MKKAVFLSLFFCLMICSASFAADIITLESLLNEMIDRDSIAQYPDPVYITRQFSSYDRDTVAPDQPGWYANWDRSQFIRQEENNGRTEWVMLDADGPGAIVRFWGTWHGPGGGKFSNGTLRIYLDNSETPAIEGPIADIISGGKFISDPLSESVSPKTNYDRRGHNLYFPIPYSKHCKITYETKVPIDRGGKKGEALYYQINYRTYEKSAKVETFSKEIMKRASEVIEKTQTALKNRTRPGETTIVNTLSGTIEPGSYNIFKVNSGAAINMISAKIKADDLPQALRATILIIEFDGKQCVWCPIGDFFGTGYGIHPYRSWYTEVTEDGTMKSFWTMPFKSNAKVYIKNIGRQNVKIESAEINAKPWKWNNASMYFHASWKQLYKLETGTQKNMTGNTAFDVNYIEIKGKGVYAGDTLTIFNGAPSWWGEGDEKIFIDGEKFPSHVGTGTEDYYGYAWCRPEFFESPFHAQPQGGGNIAGGLSVNSRYRLLDGLCFTKSIKFDMEMWHWAKTKVNFAPATFWYAKDGAVSNITPDPSQAALPVATEIEDIVPVKRVKGAIEGEDMKIVSKTGGDTEIQSGAQFGWSGNRQVWWKFGKPGDKLTLEFKSDKAGQYDVTAALTKAIDYAVIDMFINGQKVLSDCNLINNGVTNHEYKLGKCNIQNGKNTIEVIIKGADEKAVKSYMYGLDYILLK